MDFKPTILFIGALALENVNSVLTTSALGLNLIYLGYQIIVFHKKNNDKQKKDNNN